MVINHFKDFVKNAKVQLYAVSRKERNKKKGCVMERSRIVEIILSSLRALSDEKASGKTVKVSEGTNLYGPDSSLDSLGLVTLLIDVEQKINDEFDVLISLTDEKAVSQKKSPFRTVQTLTDYICKLLEESNA